MLSEKEVTHTHIEKKFTVYNPKFKINYNENHHGRKLLQKNRHINRQVLICISSAEISLDNINVQILMAISVGD